MKPSSVLLAVAVACVLLVAGAAVPRAEAASRTGCIACTILLGLLEEGAIHVHSLGVRDGTDFGVADLAHCNGDVMCEAFLKEHGEMLAASVSAGLASESPDVLCQNLKLCDGSCVLFKKWPIVPPPPPPPPTPPHFPNDTDATQQRRVDVSWDSDVEANMASMRELAKAFASVAHNLNTLPSYNDFYKTMQTLVWAVVGRERLQDRLQMRVGTGPDPCGTNLTCIISRVFDHHLPLADQDGDNFAPVETGDNGFRGADWRGRDCNDQDASVYPGRVDVGSATPDVDSNCNGISGSDATTGESYEDMYCKGSEQRGVIILGDSAAAHFHIPPEWLRARGWKLDHLVTAAEDELDWPECGWACAWNNETQCPLSALPMASFYDRLLERNKCMHRDFQNIGVNGARTTSMRPQQNGKGIIYGMSRDQEKDNPALVIFALIGNDVCNGHNGTSHMTPPKEFYEAVTDSLQYLDTKLPSGSTVLIVALVDGRILWNIMHNRTHPLGVPYADVYDFLGCSGENPCWGWLNSNATMRNVTTQWAESLNAQYAKIVATQKYEHFDLIFHNPDWQKYINAYVAAGGLAYQLIEPSDGFHPSQSGNMLLAMNMWEWLEKNAPDALGPINPHNDDITAKFGGQGGYGPTDPPYA